MNIPIEISARHLHVSRADAEKLFGQDYQLTKIKQLSQPSDFACQETVDLKIGEKVLKNLRVVGPEREMTQVEISRTDALSLDCNPPVSLSGDLTGALPVTLIGSVGQVDLNNALIIAKRHLHCSVEQAKELRIKNNDIVSIKIDSERSVIFEDIPVRVKDDYKLVLHLDTDEGNAAGIDKKAEGYIISTVSL